MTLDKSPIVPEAWCTCGYRGDYVGKKVCDDCGEDWPDDFEGFVVEECEECGGNVYELACPDCGETSGYALWDVGPESHRPETKEVDRDT